MDLSLSAKAQTLTLTSCAQRSLPYPLTKPLRSEFLGCAHYLRPPGGGRPRLRSKCKKLWVRGNRHQRFLITSELDSSAVLVLVAVTALPALSLWCFNQYLSKKVKKKKRKSYESERVSDFLGFALPQFGRSVVNHNIGSRIVVVGDLQSLVPVVQKDLVENARINSSGVEGEEIRCQESTLLPDHSLLNKRIESPEADVLASNPWNSVVSEGFEVSGLSLPLPVPLKSGDVPLMVAIKISELTLVNGWKGTVSDSEFPEPALKKNVTIASVPVNNESGFGIFEQSVREDLYAFYGVNQSVKVSPSCLNSLTAISCHASPLNSNEFPLLKANPVLKGAECSAEQSIDIAERKVPFAHCDGGSSRKNKNLGRGKGLPRGKERRNLALENHTKLPELPHPNGKIVKDKDYLPEQLRAYNHLLRVGRLSDCVNILEDLERRGLLDMNKLYHAKFFEICRRQKDVKEAFRFCKLIPNPTLSTFNMLMSVCASSQDSEGAFQVLRLSRDAGLKADCKLYTTLISTCAKSGRVDAMFEVFHEMVNAGVEPNAHTYGALIDGCAKAGQIAKAFGAYGIMRSKNVKPDRVVFNALITACGQSGAVDRAFDVLAEMKGETQPIDPDHITVGALIKACANAGQVDRAKEVYNILHEYQIKGTPEVYTIAVNCFSEIGDWDFARSVYDDMKIKGVIPDEVFLSALIDVAGHAGKIDAAFEILQEARIQGKKLGIITYSSLMGACSNAKNWQKALELYEDIKFIKLKPTVSTMNALITALCDGDQLPKAMEVLPEMKSYGLCPNTITYSTLLVASEKEDDLEVGLTLRSLAKADGVALTLLTCKCIIGMCLRRFEKACALGEPVLSFDSGRPQLHNEWTTLALTVYREAIAAGEMPSLDVVSQLLGCLQLPGDASLKKKLVENLGVTVYSSKCSSLWPLVDGFGEYDPRAFSLLEEAASLGIVQCVSFKESPIVVDAKKLQTHTAEVYLLTILKGLKHRLAAGAKIPNVTIYLPVDKARITTPDGCKTINVAGRVGQKVASLLRRLGLPYLGNESYGKIRINGISLRRWLRPKLASPFSGKYEGLSFSQSVIGKGIIDQQRNIRTVNFSLE